MEHLYYPAAVSKLPTVGGKVTDYLDYNMQMKLQGNSDITLMQLIPQISPEGKVSAYWFGSFPSDANIAEDRNVILRTTTQYDMPVLSPTVKVASGDTLQEIEALVNDNPEPWDWTSWHNVQTASVGAITQEFIDEAREYFDESVNWEIWDEDTYGSARWDSKFLLGKSIPVYTIRSNGELSDTWASLPELCASLNLLFPTLVNVFSQDYERNPYMQRFLTHGMLKSEYDKNEYLNGVCYDELFKLDNLAISLERGYAAFGNFESVSSEVLHAPLGMLHPFLITAYFTKSLNKAEKAFPNLRGLFKTSRKISTTIGGFSEMFWKPYYNLCGVFDD